jgi:hypothetical protein
MSNQYNLSILNNSTQVGDFCIYQEIPDVNRADIVTLAWLSKPAHPTTTLEFDWMLDYSFVWSKTTNLKPGTKVITSQAWDANLNTLNRVAFDYERDAYTFKNPEQGAYEGNLYIDQSQRVQSNSATVGIGMSGKGTHMIPSQPNIQVIMTPKPTYWVVFGTFSEGEVLDIAQVSSQACKVEFKGTTNMAIEYTANNSWKVLS